MISKLHSSRSLLIALLTLFSLSATSQTDRSLLSRTLFDETIFDDFKAADSLLSNDTLVIDTTIFVDDMRFPKRFFGDMVYSGVILKDSVDEFHVRGYESSPVISWIERQKFLDRIMSGTIQRVTFANPSIVRYNESLLPEPPKIYQATVDPSKAQIEITEIGVDRSKVKEAPKAVEIEKRNWLRSLDANLQFSQAYNSPNCYQGGNNNLNMILNTVYNVKLNSRFGWNAWFSLTL